MMDHGSRYPTIVSALVIFYQLCQIRFPPFSAGFLSLCRQSFHQPFSLGSFAGWLPGKSGHWVIPKIGWRVERRKNLGIYSDLFSIWTSEARQLPLHCSADWSPPLIPSVLEVVTASWVARAWVPSGPLPRPCPVTSLHPTQT